MLTSCQVTSIPSEIWKLFRKICIEEEISANRKMLRLIEVEVGRHEGAKEFEELKED